MRSDPAHGGPGRWGPVVVVVPVRPAGGRRALGRRTYGLGWVKSDGPSCVPASPRSPLLPGVRPPSSPSHSRRARRSPGALAHSKRGRREASAGAAILRPRRPPCRAPGPRGVRPPGGRSRIIGWFGRVCVSNGILGSRDPGRFFKIRQNRIYKFANRCCCFAVFLGG